MERSVDHAKACAPNWISPRLFVTIKRAKCMLTKSRHEHYK